MAAVFPVGLKGFSANYAHGDIFWGTYLNQVEEEINAIETKLGIDESDAITSIDYLLKNSASLDPGHKHNLATGATDITATQAEIDRAFDITVNGFFKEGTAVRFYEDSNPAGYTYEDDIKDNVLAVKADSGHYNVDGGTYDKGYFYITEAQMPQHFHGGVATSYGGSSAPHPIFDNDGPGYTEYYPSTQATTYRPRAAVGIICSKNA